MKKMNNTVLQVRVNTKLKELGERKAEESGFGSLQNLVRWFITNFSKDQIKVGVYEKTEPLTQEQLESLEKDYQQFLKDEKEGKTFTANNVEELMEYLES